MKKIILASALSSAIILTGCGSSGSDEVAQIVADLEVTVSGKITNLNDTAEPGVVVEGIYSNPGDLLNPSITTDSNGNFSLDVLKNEAVYLRAAKDTFASINSQKAALSSDVTDLDIGMPTEIQAQELINLVFTSAPPNLADKAWLVVEVVDEANGEDVAGKTIIAVAAPDTEAYPDCNGAPGATSTVAGCINRASPMYLAYYDASTEVTVTVDNETQTAPIRMGEITGLEFTVTATVPVGSIAAGQAKYDAYCASCHKAGTYDDEGSASDLYGNTSALITSLSSIPGMKNVDDISTQDVLDLTAFLDSL